MIYLLTIWLYLEATVIEAEFDTLAECLHYETIAHERFSNIITECKETAPAF